MSEQKTKFEIACETRLKKVVIGELRAFGRHVGVENPTVHNKKVLIEAIINVLMGRVAPVPRPTRGAPIKADYFDPQLEKEINSYRTIYADSFFDSNEYTVTGEQAAAQMQRLREELGWKENVLIMRSSATESLEKSVVVGQLEMIDGASCLVPLNGEQFPLKIIVKTELIHDYSLREGDIVTCKVMESRGNYFVVIKILTVNGVEPSELTRFSFDDEDVYLPDKKISLREKAPKLALAKYLDWFIPLASGQRCLISAPPKAGKSYMLQTVASALAGQENYEVLGLLVEQSPETVSAFKRILKTGNVAATVYGDPADAHVFTAELMWKRAKRFAEMGKDVVLLIDGLVNLAEAFNELEETNGGKTPVFGLNGDTVRYLKKFFCAARNFEKGSLTIVATAKQAGGNPMADFLAAELLDMANCRISLSDELAKKRIYPAIELSTSGVDQAEELLGETGASYERYTRNKILPALGEEKLHELLLGSETIEEFLERAKAHL